MTNHTFLLVVILIILAAAYIFNFLFKTKCPKCESRQLKVEESGGGQLGDHFVFGTGNYHTYRTCKKCGHRQHRTRPTDSWQ